MLFIFLIGTATSSTPAATSNTATTPITATTFAPSSNAELKAAIAECRTAPANDGPKGPHQGRSDHALTTSPKPKVKKSNLYTGGGDKGESSLYNGARVPKDNLIFEALGGTDELNAHLGVAREYCRLDNNGIDEYLTEIQSRLLDLGSAIATPVDSSSQKKLERVSFDAAHVKTLEEWTDSLDAQLPPLTTFILPSGGLASSHLHVARTVCRRAERCAVPLSRDGQVPAVVSVYLNRLSDFLFAAARFASKTAGATETRYKVSDKNVHS